VGDWSATKKLEKEARIDINNFPNKDVGYAGERLGAAAFQEGGKEKRKRKKVWLLFWERGGKGRTWGNGKKGSLSQ